MKAVFFISATTSLFLVIFSFSPLAQASNFLPTPKNLLATYNVRGGVDITWQAPPKKNFLGYFLYRSKIKNKLGKRIAILPRSKTSYFDGTGFKSNTTFYYTLKTYGKQGKSTNKKQTEFIFPPSTTFSVGPPAGTVTPETKFQEFLTNDPSLIHTDDIVFAVNEDFPSRDPDWRTHADEVIQKLNEIFGRNTNKRFKIVKYITYPLNTSSDSLSRDTSYYLPHDNRALTIFFYGPEPGKSTPRGFQVSIGQKIDGVTYCGAFTRSGNLDVRGPVSSQIKSLMAHEVAHCFGVRHFVESMVDHTLTEPPLEPYSIGFIYPLDPMGLLGGEPITFNDLNAFIINHNWNQRWNSTEIENMAAAKVIVRVKDASGNPIADAQIQVFAGSILCEDNTISSYCQGNSFYGEDANGKNILLETISTNQNGEAEIQPPSDINKNILSEEQPVYPGKIIKVQKMLPSGSMLKGGAYVSHDHLEEAKVLRQQEVYYMDILVQ